MNATLPKTEQINLDIAPVDFEVYQLNRFGQRFGKQSLKIDREGFRLIDNKGRTVSTVGWNKLGEFKDKVREKGRFSYFGIVSTALNDVRTIIRVGLGDDPSEREKLAAIFDKLPQDVFGPRCPSCGGAVIENVCKNCGQTLSGQRRRKGLNVLLIGAIILLIGIVLTSTSSNPIYVYPVALGAGMVIAGLIGLISGKRV
ncbi:MAG: hypothetical protein NTV82_02705 [Candidatus Aminicenantes bacterium]|nr:hypothetical protein [Candidatus Aminicenantes bacterium]